MSVLECPLALKTAAFSAFKITIKISKLKDGEMGTVKQPLRCVALLLFPPQINPTSRPRLLAAKSKTSVAKEKRRRP